jgi:queuosine precursor transporter
MIVVVLYLSAIVCANLLVTHFGPEFSVISAFFLIGLNLTARDYLHDLWRGRNLFGKMTLLILGGSVLSWTLNKESSSIAIASFIAFAVSEFVDAIVYTRLSHTKWAVRVNGSNIFSAAADSLIFPVVAFGGFMPLIFAGQFAAKVFGGALWAFGIRRFLPATLILISAAYPLSGQVVSVGFGELRTEYSSSSVVDVSVLVPMGLITTVSYDLNSGEQPTFLAQKGFNVTGFPVVIGADVGIIAGPWDGYNIKPTLGLRSLSFASDRVKVIAIMSWQPTEKWGRTSLIKVDYTIKK